MAPKFDPTITAEGVRAATEAAEEAAANPEAFEQAKMAAAGSSSVFAFLHTPLEFLSSAFHVVLQAIRDVKFFVLSNAWSIVFALIIGYMVKTYLDPYYEEWQARRSYREATDPKRTQSLDADLRRIRAKQQEETQRKALEAKEAAEKKKAEEAAKKRIKQPMEDRGGEGRRLGGGEERPRRRRPDNGTTSNSSRPGSSGYNPMNPWSSSGGGGYRAPRRDVNRRGG